MKIATSLSTIYSNGQRSIRAGGIAPGESVIVVGVVAFGAQGRAVTTITAEDVILQPAAAVVSAKPAPVQQRGQAAPEQRIGEIPADYVEGGGTVINGPEANKATEAALKSEFYQGGLINPVVKQNHGIYECHNLVAGPHHIFVNSDFKVIGAF